MISTIFMLLGSCVAGLGLWIRWKAGQAASWPGTQATILESKVVQDPHDSDSSYVIQYRYEVAGKIHECQNLGYGVRTNSKEAHEALVARYPQGSVTTAYYDPASPASAVIEKEVTPGWILALLFGILFAIVGYFLPA